MENNQTIPTGTTIEVVLDRMKRASNFASNGVYFAGIEGRDPIETADLYIRAATSMLDEARRALETLAVTPTPTEETTP